MTYGDRPGEELRVLSHPLVQAEFDRQERDLHDLLAVSGREFAELVKRVRDRAIADATVFFGTVS